MCIYMKTVSSDLISIKKVGDVDITCLLGCLYCYVELKFPQQNVLWKQNWIFPLCFSDLCSSKSPTFSCPPQNWVPPWWRRCRPRRWWAVWGYRRWTSSASSSAPCPPPRWWASAPWPPCWRTGLPLDLAPSSPPAVCCTNRRKCRWDLHVHTAAAAAAIPRVEEREMHGEGSALNSIAEICWKIWNLVVKMIEKDKKKIQGYNNLDCNQPKTDKFHANQTWKT